jgi:cobaltochelatase CobS
MERGAWLCANEYDTLRDDVMNILKPVQEFPRYLPIPELGDVVIHAHPDFRFIAPSNTWGRGDASGQYTNTRMQSEADLRRINARLKFDYLPEAVEIAMLLKYFPALSKDQAKKFVQVANKVRGSYKAGKIDKTLSPAELICWVENWFACGKTVHHAARLTFVNALEPEVATHINELIVPLFGSEPRK